MSPTDKDVTDSTCISRINDAFRQSSHYALTRGVINLGVERYLPVIQLVREYDDFDTTANDDPYKEHDFGSVQYADLLFFWKIDYYDNDLAYLSPNPADPTVTQRVLTLMLASEY